MNNTIQHLMLYLFEVCYDTDNEAGMVVLDAGADGCDWYTNRTTLCGEHDDDNFFSNQMCCACGGGTSGNIPCILYLISRQS